MQGYWVRTFIVRKTHTFLRINSVIPCKYSFPPSCIDKSRYEKRILETNKNIWFYLMSRRVEGEWVMFGKQIMQSRFLVRSWGWDDQFRVSQTYETCVHVFICQPVKNLFKGCMIRHSTTSTIRAARIERRIKSNHTKRTEIRWVPCVRCVWPSIAGQCTRTFIPIFPFISSFQWLLCTLLLNFNI